MLHFLVETVRLNYTRSLALSHFRQAALSYRKACYVEAIQHYLAGLKLGSVQHHYIYADIAKAYEMIGKWDNALACLDIALRLCPDSPTALRRKARVLDEKACYDALICSNDLREPPPQAFLKRLEQDPTQPTKQVVVSNSFKLICPSAMSPQAMWDIYQLVHKTRADLGKMFGCYPLLPPSVSITNSSGANQVQRSLPKWASGFYNGSIHLEYCAAGDPVLSVLYALLRHEWVHLLVDHLTDGSCPVWLNEGLAQNIARPMFQSERFVLKNAIDKNRLLSFATLSHPFSELPIHTRKLAYIQSASIATFLIHEFGFPKIREFLHELRIGNDTAAAFEKVFEQGLTEVPLAGVS